MRNTTVENSNAVNQWLSSGYWKNEVDIVSVKVRACMSSLSTMDLVLFSPGATKDGSLDIVGNGLYQDYEIRVFNGSVQEANGQLEIYWIGPQPSPTWNIALNGFVKA